MVYIGNPIKMDDLGVLPFSETPIYYCALSNVGHVLLGIS
jgi:hypothetical protein